MPENSFIDIFEEQVLKTPGNIAVVFQDEQLTYSALNANANRLAHALRKSGVQADTPVPLYLERGIEMIVAILGIMKAGGAYVPIDYDFPAERINYMLADTAAKIIVSSTSIAARLPATEATIIAMDEKLDYPEHNLSEKVQPNQLAYIIYTSGSTGSPKGVMIEHSALADYIVGLINTTTINTCSSFALVSTIATDLGNTVIYGALATGGTLHLFTKEAVSNIEYLHTYFSEHTIDCLKIVPAHWKVLNLGEVLLLPNKLLIFGGEALQQKIIGDIRATGSGCTIVNHYGPTETTIGKLLYVVDEDATFEFTVPVGKPFSNTKVLILTKNLKLCPIGVPGQLYIAGAGLARGYWNNPELSSEKFIPNPFAKQAHSIMYNTGDLVKYLPDGNIAFIGRADNQVKIRGYRIELGEIESIMQQCQLISQAVVLATDDKQGNKRLVAYIVPQGDLDKEAINIYLQDKLPDYMIPSIMLELTEFPLTANGKIDRNALPDPETTVTAEQPYTPARNEIEARLITIWQDVLEVDTIGIHNDFFELGGHSLLAVRLVSAIRKAFSIEMPIGDIFDYPTVALLSAQIPCQSDADVLPVIQQQLQRPQRIPLSFSQERLWFIHQLDGSVHYHVPAVLRLTGDLDINALTHSLQTITDRHEILRTVIAEEDGMGYQLIKEPGKWQLNIVNSGEFQQNKAALDNYIQQCIQAPFNLTEDYMLRAQLLVMGINEHLLIVTLHHIASDGWSASVMVNELINLYDAFILNKSVALTPLPLQYSDYAIWQRSYLHGALLEQKISYWKKQLAGVAVLQLPTDRKRPAVQSTKGVTLNFSINQQVYSRLQHLGKQRGVTLFMTLLAALKVMLYRYTGQQDICVGTPVAGRHQQETENLIGYFINTIAVRNWLDGEDSFTATLDKIKQTTLEAYANQDAPFEKVVEAVVSQRDMARSPIYQVMFVLQNTPPLPPLQLGNVQMQPEKFDHSLSMFDLSLSVKENQGSLDCYLEYSTALFEASTISKMIGHYMQVLNAVVSDPNQRIGYFPMLTPAQTNEILTIFNNTAVNYPTDKSVVQLFEEQVKQTPGNTAIVCEGETFTYQQLNQHANQLGHYLQTLGVGVGSLVPFCINRSPKMLVTILAILKVGAAYVPLDPDYPSDRIAHMLADTAAPLVLITTENQGRLPQDTAIRVIDIDKETTTIENQATNNLNCKISPQELAYIVYTSGSTGKPKGVMIELAAILNFVLLVQKYFSITDNDHVIQQSSPSFDVLVEEVYPALISGACLYIIKEGGKDIARIKDYIESNAVTIISTTPMVLEYLNKELTHTGSLRYIIVGGDVLYPSNITNFFGKIPIVNGYGPSEATVCASYNIVQNIEEASVIGTPIDNGKVYITNKEGQLVPVGVTGEICIAGAGLARGYLNNQELTLEKFVNDPFSAAANAKMYKTGDAARWLPDGRIDYLGRIDEQVKIRGYRVELGEIQHVIQQAELVSDSVVLALPDKHNHKRLVAYIISNKNSFDKEAMLAYLSTKLPDYMIPSLWVTMDQFPLTPNGKLDKKAMPYPGEENAVTNTYVGPRNEWEQNLANIWKELLGVPAVGIKDNFFELGGDSILTLQLVSRANRLGYSLQARDVFIHQDIDKLSRALAQRKQASASGEQGLLSGSAGLLPVQHWYLKNTQVDLSHFNQSVLLTVNKEVSAIVWQMALQQLVLQHDALRFKYTLHNDNWIQEYTDIKYELTTENFLHTPPGHLTSIIETVAGNYQQSLDIEKGELVKMVWMQTPVTEAGNRLLIVIHHLAVDGVSWRILLADLELLIAAFTQGTEMLLPQKTASIRQWHYALQQYGKSERLLSQVNYWLSVTKRTVPLPVDKQYDEPLLQKDFDYLTVQINNKKTSALLHEVPKAYHTEINDVLLSALGITLCKWSNTNEIVIALEGHGREDIDKSLDTSYTVGWFTSIYPVLLKIEQSFAGSVIKSVKETLRAVPDKGLGYGVLKYLNNEPGLQKNASPDILFNYLGQADNVFSNHQMSLATESYGLVKSNRHIVSEKMTITAYIESGELTIKCDYSLQHFDKNTIAILADEYVNQLEKLIDHCIHQQQSGSVFTPSDFGLGADITVAELDNFLEADEEDNVISF